MLAVQVSLPRLRLGNMPSAGAQDSIRFLSAGLLDAFDRSLRWALASHLSQSQDFYRKPIGRGSAVRMLIRILLRVL